VNEHVHPIFQQVLATVKPPTKHVITKRSGPGVYIVSCSCGASRQFPRQNALARAAKVRAWINAHLSSADSERPR
jgi:hypothetical protein